MTPKDKAKELIEKFSFNCRECDNFKLSALIAVNEILDDYEAFPYKAQTGKEYWQEVKTEIENL